MNFEWEKVFLYATENGTNITMRAKVIGGWVVNNQSQTIPARRDIEPSLSESMCFVPDVNHEWVI